MGLQVADMTVMPDQARCEETTAPELRPFRQSLMLADDGRFLLDHFLGRFCNPFYRLNSEADLYDQTMDRLTDEPMAVADFKALESGTQAPDELQRELGAFLADSLVDDYVRDFRGLVAGPSSGPPDVSRASLQAHRIRALNPFRPLLSPELERHLMRTAAARCGRESSSSSTVEPAALASLPEQSPIPRPRSEHEARFRQRIENLRALRNISLRGRAHRPYSVLIVGAGPAGLIRAISATLQGLKTVVLELRPEDATKRPQIVVIRSQAVIALLDQLGVIDFLFMENRVFPLGRLQLEVSLADLDLAFKAVLRLVAGEQDRIVQHGTVIERIEQERGFARVIARNSDQQTSLSFSPQLIVVADGKRSPTSALLGISRCDRFHSHTGIIAIFRADGKGLSRGRQMLGALASKLNYAFHRYVSRKGAGLMAGTILQVPGHHYLGLDLARDEEMRLRNALARAGEGQFAAEGVSANGSASSSEREELGRLLRFWARYGFEAIRTHPKGSAPHTGGRRISWLPLDPQLAMPIEVVSDRAEVFCGHIGETFVMIEGDAQFTIHPGSAYGCTKAFLSARLFDFLLRAGLSRPDGHGRRSAERVFFCNSELMARECRKITRFFRVTA